MLLAMDPGLISCGVALFEGTTLTAAGVVKYKAPKGADVLDRVLGVARGVRNWTLSQGGKIDALAAEWPPVYAPGKETKGGPKAVIPLAGVCGAVAALLEPESVTSYLPAEWAGQVRKAETVKGAKTSPRAKKIVRRLSADEMAVWSTVKYHDTIDAIGIGLRHVGRFDRIRVIAR